MDWPAAGSRGIDGSGLSLCYWFDIVMDNKKSALEREAEATLAASNQGKKHPSRSLEARKRGFGIGGGYERIRGESEKIRIDCKNGLYGPVPHSGYYGGGRSSTRFSIGQAGFRDELSLYPNQFGDETSGYKKKA